MTIFLKKIENNLALEGHGISMSLKCLEDAKSGRSGGQHVSVLSKHKRRIKFKYNHKKRSDLSSKR